jgi:hypothetical protein
MGVGQAMCHKRITVFGRELETLRRDMYQNEKRYVSKLGFCRAFDPVMGQDKLEIQSGTRVVFASSKLKTSRL